MNGSFVNCVSISEPAFHCDGNYGSVSEVRRSVKQ